MTANDNRHLIAAADPTALAEADCGRVLARIAATAAGWRFA
jgi:hypothetical protein